MKIDQQIERDGGMPHLVDELDELFAEPEEIEDVPDEDLATITDMAEFVAVVNAQMGGQG